MESETTIDTGEKTDKFTDGIAEWERELAERIKARSEGRATCRARRV